MLEAVRPVGEQLRDWRQRRRLSQLDLACEANVSARHLSFVETGRSQPSRDMILRLADQLDVPLRERNVLLLAAGFAPVFPERPLSDPALDTARRAVELVLKGHEPYPALAVDRHWTLVAANDAVQPLLGDTDPELLRPPVNVLRLSLHPAGVAPRITNLPEWRAHVLARVRRQVDVTADAALASLLKELSEYPMPAAELAADSAAPSPFEHAYNAVVVPFKLRVGGAILSFISTTTVFGTPVDITLSELAVESFFPADPATADALRRASTMAG